MASPGDLVDERASLQAEVNRLNKNLGRILNGHIDLYGWEDTRPGFARPQHLINKEVDECDLFIGMLGRRWGSPTGTFSSGFEEEFTLAVERRRKTGKPEIWLLFRSLPEDSKNDPGDQLKRVLAFRQEQIERRELLFREFADLKSFSDLMNDFLSGYIAEKHQTLEAE